MLKEETNKLRIKKKKRSISDRKTVCTIPAVTFATAGTRTRTCR